MPNLDDFIAAEMARTSRWDRFMRNYPDIRTTRFHAVFGARKFPPEMVLRPSVGVKLQAVVFLFFSGVAWLAVVGAMDKGSLSPFVSWLILIGLPLLVCRFFYRNFLSGRRNFALAFDAGGIAVDDQKFPWNDLAETAILTKRSGRTTRNSLVLLGKDGSVRVFDCWLLQVSDEKLATIIEYYKHGPKGLGVAESAS
jgi:hypothetical protein